MKRTGGAEAGADARSLAYRPDIDGLRAIAVLGVILGHAGVPFLRAGYLGVDVFFVISGYLITTILRHDLESGRLRMARFYERRARRILPALVLVSAACVPFALLLLLPDFLQNFGQSLVATMLFSNNILLALTSGYWELESGYKPLLHTWSLGVEEQFYFAFPLLLAAVWRFGRRAQVGLIVVLGLVSFGFAEYGWRTHPAASFYLPTSRAWELMAGCAIAYVPIRARRWDNLAAFLALLAVIAPMVVFDENIPSPSLYSAVAVLGAAGIVLFSRPGTLASAILSVRPVVFVGLISYSAYLWHQPLFAFARAASFAPPGAGRMAALSILTLVLAAASWRWVEVPFRNSAAVPLRRFVPIVAAPTAALVALGLVPHFAQGFPRWTFPNIAAAGDVHIAYNERIRGFAAKAFPANGRPNVLLLGDSFGRDAGNVLIESGALAGMNLVYRYSYVNCSGPAGEQTVPPALFAQASVVVVALDSDMRCVRPTMRELERSTRAPLVFFGTKSFGANIHPLARVQMAERRGTLATVEPEVAEANERAARIVGEDRYIDLIRLLGPDGRHVRFFDDAGNPLTPDRSHLTRYGAVAAARRLRETDPPAFRTITALSSALDYGPAHDAAVRAEGR
jgi:peptidoglycan/LPS O-acetylase OafA/YrhL